MGHIRGYLKEPFKSRLFHFPVGSLEYNPEPANEKPGVGQDTHGTAATGADVFRILDQFGTDIVVLNPGYNRPQAIFNEPVIAAIASAHNDYLINEVFPVSDRIKASLMICHRDPQMGADEIRRVGHHQQFVSVFTSFSGLFEPLGCAKFDPILDAMAEHNLVLTAHSEGWFPHFSPLWTGSRTWIELFGNAPAGNAMAHLAAMICQGMFDKYPKQKVIFQEGGYWWIPDFMLRLDDFFMSSSGDIALIERKLASGERNLKKLPSEYVLEHVRFSTQPITDSEKPQAFRVDAGACHAEDCSASLRTGRTRHGPRQLGGRKSRLHRRGDAEENSEWQCAQAVLLAAVIISEREQDRQVNGRRNWRRSIIGMELLAIATASASSAATHPDHQGVRAAAGSQAARA